MRIRARRDRIESHPYRTTPRSPCTVRWACHLAEGPGNGRPRSGRRPCAEQPTANPAMMGSKGNRTGRTRKDGPAGRPGFWFSGPTARRRPTSASDLKRKKPLSGNQEKETFGWKPERRMAGGATTDNYRAPDSSIHLYLQFATENFSESEALGAAWCTHPVCVAVSPLLLLIFFVWVRLELEWSVVSVGPCLFLPSRGKSFFADFDGLNWAVKISPWISLDRSGVC